jgi:hypothetical protein
MGRLVHETLHEENGMNSKYLAKAVTLMIAGAAALGCSVEAGDAESGEESVDSTTQELTSEGTYGWLWANQSTGTYTPNSNYSYNTSGGTNRVVNLSTGSYRVEFPGIGQANGNVQVNAYGGSNARCKVSSWGPSGSQLNVNVVCHTASGSLTNTQFVVKYHRGASTDLGGYVWANQPTTASYTAPSSYSWNSAAGSNTIQREGTGLYAVSLAGLTGTGGNALVTAYGSGPEHCKVRGWGSNSEGTVVRVACFAAGGSAVDSNFTLSFAGRVFAPEQYGAFVWANDATSAEYDPDSAYRSTSSRGQAGILETQARPSAGRTSAGSYYVHYPYMPAADKTVALATAYGTTSDYCKVHSWVEHGGDVDDDQGARVYVRCFDAAGNAKDGRFTQNYAYHSFLIF